LLTLHNHTGVLAEVHPVHHQRDEVEAGEVRGEQLSQGGLGLRDEPARHRRFGRADRGLLRAGSDGFEPTP
jgi:hypothetical protein